MTISRRALMVGSAATCAAALFCTGYSVASYRETVAGAQRRIAQRSTVIKTQSGDLEYAIQGHGVPFLMVHGTGGGFDQGLRFADGLVSSGFEVIAPSRFGYLRSGFPSDPSPQNQADAYADLLDALNIDRIAIAGGSAGALSAAYFALRHPDRCSHLILIVPAMNLTNRDPVEFTRMQRYFVEKLLSSDLWFWAALKLAPHQLIGTLLATDPNLLQTVSATERERAFLVLNELMPISHRAKGIANDGTYSGRPSDIDFSLMTIPTLVVSAEDDRFGTAETSRVIAEKVPAAELLVFPTGGHIWLGHDRELWDRITDFVGRSGRDYVN